jgi:hypothetical protein
MRINIHIYFYLHIYIYTYIYIYSQPSQQPIYIPYPVEEIFRGRNFDVTRPMYPDQFSAEEVHTDTYVYTCEKLALYRHTFASFFVYTQLFK